MRDVPQIRVPIPAKAMESAQRNFQALQKRVKLPAQEDALVDRLPYPVTEYESLSPGPDECLQQPGNPRIQLAVL
jgi:hypothetical protein